MRRFIMTFGLMFLFLACAKENQQSTAMELDKNFVHVVYFWLNNPESQEDRKEFLASLNKFMDASEYAATKFIGEPAKTPREVVDNTFTYSLILSFPSAEIQDLYQKEPAHLKFIEESEHLWERVQVYDNIYYKQ
ncbi:MAG: stress responsive protein [Cytophagaceae bacterium]|nr:stress responsive protein [Cytophagaceae bacterium]